MKIGFFILSAGMWLLSYPVLRAQSDIENVLVEYYYVSDTNDATDEDGGLLPEGSVTYRIFVDLAPCARLRAVYADQNHPLIISSTTNFFNNEDRGKTFGYLIDAGRLDENTVALDSWLTIGAASDEHFGIPKSLDPDTSIVGGVNNDGGSAAIAEGLMTNFTSSMEIAITDKDGLVAHVDTLLDDIVVAGDDLSTVFDDASVASLFESSGMTVLSPDGIVGADDQNLLLVAQLTTSGELEFELNIEVINCDGQIVKYVAGGDTLLENEFLYPLLKFPPQCGCTDPEFLEYDPYAACDDGSCTTLVVLGCGDPAACNYDPDVNLNVQELCCILPDNCDGLDPALICPGYTYIGEDFRDVRLVPNPADESVSVLAGVPLSSIVISDINGRIVYRASDSDMHHVVDCSHFAPGMYLVDLMGKDAQRGVYRLVIQ